MQSCMRKPKICNGNLSAPLECHLPRRQCPAHTPRQFVAGKGGVLALAAQLGVLHSPACLRVHHANITHTAFGQLANAGLQCPQSGPRRTKSSDSAGDSMKWTDNGAAPSAAIARRGASCTE